MARYGGVRNAKNDEANERWCSTGGNTTVRRLYFCPLVPAVADFPAMLRMSFTRLAKA
jgi:hypothetical protein